MTTIEEDYVSFETAKLLKEKGFPQSTFRCHYIIDGNVHYKSFENRCGFGDYDIIAPTLQMAMKWLREVHGVTIVIDTNDIWLGEGNRFYWCKIYYKMGDRIEIKWYNDHSKPKDILRYQTYEQACEAAIKYCLKHLI